MAKTPKVPTVESVTAEYKKKAVRHYVSKKVKIPTVESIEKGYQPNKAILPQAVGKAFFDALDSIDVIGMLAKEANKKLASKKKEKKPRRFFSKKKTGPLVTTKHVDWKKAASGPVSANMNLGVTSGNAKDRVWAAAKLFYQIVVNTPLDENYEYTKQPKKKSSKEIKDKKAFKFIKDENGLMKVVPVDVVKPVKKSFHVADGNVTRNNWVLKVTTTKGTAEIRSGSLGINFDQPSDTGWKAVADRIKAEIGRFKPKDVEIVNEDPYIDVLEYGRYGKHGPSTTSERREGPKYLHGTVSGYSVQAPRGIMRVAASQLNNLQLEADKESKGVISDSMLSSIPVVTLELNADNLKDYTPVNKSVSDIVKDFEEREEFVTERQIGEAFMNDKPTVDVVVKRSERNAKAVNKRMFEKQISSKEVAEALFREIQRASKVISRQERAENRALKEIWGNQMSAVKAAGKLGSKFDKEIEKELNVILKSKKTNVVKKIQEKPVQDKKDKKDVQPIEGTLFAVQAPNAWSRVQVGDKTFEDFLCLRQKNGTLLFTVYKSSYQKKTEEEFRIYAAENNIFKTKEEFFTKGQVNLGITKQLDYSRIDEYYFEEKKNK